MVANSQISVKSGKRNITSTGNGSTNAAPEPQVRIEIVEQALLNYQKVGGRIEIANVAGGKAVAIVLYDAFFCSKCHHLSASKVCQYCASTSKQQSASTGTQPETNVPVLAQAEIAPR